MKHNIGDGSNVQEPAAVGYESLSGFEAGVCGTEEAPKIWYSAEYIEDADFCATSNC